MTDNQQRLTLEEAAERAGVHYMTAYRWVRTSRIPAEKQDGRWYVVSTDIDAMQVGRGPAAPAAPRRQATSLPIDRLRGRLILGDTSGAMTLIEESMTAGLDVETVHLSLLTGAMRSVGEEWAAGRISVGDEHRATATTRQLLGGLASHFARRGRRRGTVLLGTPKGDHHDLPSALLAGPIRGRGFDVVDLGADLPSLDIGEAAASADRLVAVGLHASIRVDGGMTSAIEAVREQNDGVPIVVGGAGVVDVAHAHHLGADHLATSPNEALDLLAVI